MLSWRRLYRCVCSIEIPNTDLEAFQGWDVCVNGIVRNIPSSAWSPTVWGVTDEKADRSFMACAAGRAVHSRSWYICGKF
jgi:hypothetical protein